MDISLARVGTRLRYKAKDEGFYEGTVTTRDRKNIYSQGRRLRPKAMEEGQHEGTVTTRDKKIK